MPDMTKAIASPFVGLAEGETTDLQQLDQLIAHALAAKEEAANAKAIYDTLRDQICAIVKQLPDGKVETATGKVRLKETKSGWVYSAATEALAIQLKTQQQIEKRNGTAQPETITVSADVFPL